LLNIPYVKPFVSKFSNNYIIIRNSRGRGIKNPPVCKQTPAGVIVGFALKD